MRSAFIELLHVDGQTEINMGTKRRIIFFLAFFPDLTQTVTQ